MGTLPSGEVDYQELEERLRANAARPAIVNVNIGTTVRGAVDDLDRVLAILEVRARRRSLLSVVARATTYSHRISTRLHRQQATPRTASTSTATVLSLGSWCALLYPMSIAVACSGGMVSHDCTRHTAGY